MIMPSLKSKFGYGGGVICSPFAREQWMISVVQNLNGHKTPVGKEIDLYFQLAKKFSFKDPMDHTISQESFNKAMVCYYNCLSYVYAAIAYHEDDLDYTYAVRKFRVDSNGDFVIGVSQKEYDASNGKLATKGVRIPRLVCAGLGTIRLSWDVLPVSVIQNSYLAWFPEFAKASHTRIDAQHMWSDLERAWEPIGSNIWKIIASRSGSHLPVIIDKTNKVSWRWGSLPTFGTIYPDGMGEI